MPTHMVELHHSSDKNRHLHVPLELAQDVSQDGSVIDHLGDAAQHLKQSEPVAFPGDLEAQTKLLDHLGGGREGGVPAVGSRWLQL